MTTYLIASNAIFSILFLVFWTKFLGLKKSSSKEISDLKQQVEKEIAIESQMREEVSTDNKKIESLLKEVLEVRKEKEEEIRLRMEAEKQIALAIQKTDDIQKRMNDWKVAQESAMKDSQSAIIKVGEDLYQKLHSDHEVEIETNKNLLDKVTDYIKKTAALVQSATTIKAAPDIHEVHAESAPTNEDIAKQMLADLAKSMQDSNHTEGKQYFLASTFDADKAKLFLCEAAFLQDAHLYLMDFKACNFMHDYMQNPDKSSAQKSLEQKLDKYITYLGNPKYRAAIIKSITSKNVSFESGDIIVVMPSHLEIEVLAEIGYLEKIESTDAKIATFDEIIELTL